MPPDPTKQTQLLARFFGYALLVIAFWGFWVAGDVVHYNDFAGSVPNKGKLSAITFVLSWLVIFGPFAYFGVRILRRSFASEERSWLIPLRVFTYLVGRRFSVEKQRREFFNNSTAKSLPSSTSSQDYLDMPPAPSARAKTHETVRNRAGLDHPIRKRGNSR